MRSNGFAPRCRSLYLQKDGNAPENYEDASAAAPKRGRFAIADGATEASFAGLWARLIVEGFVNARGRGLDWLADARTQWAAEVDGLTLPWYVEEKREEGGFATLLGIRFRSARSGQPGTWKALAVGDSCLFHTRRGRVRASFPISRAEEFSNSPPLLCSRGGEPHALRASGQWRTGDRFLLATDALAQWICAGREAGGRPAEVLGRLLDEANPLDAFAEWAAEQRHGGLLRNDDLTLLAIDL